MSNSSNGNEPVIVYTSPAPWPGHAEQMKKLAAFLECERIEYRDLDMSERYIVTKNGKTIVLEACGNRYDGGFLRIE